MRICNQCPFCKNTYSGLNQQKLQNRGHRGRLVEGFTMRHNVLLLHAGRNKTSTPALTGKSYKIETIGMMELVYSAHYRNISVM